MLEQSETVPGRGCHPPAGPVDLFYENTGLEANQPVIYLCRCGASTKKPFCDGTHSKIGFQAAAKIVPKCKEE